MRRIKHLCSALTAFVMFCICSVTAMAYDYDDLPEGTYQIKAELSCYVNAMGGVEFGKPLLMSSSVTVAADGSRTMTLHFTKSQVTIYGITCDTFVDVLPSYVTETNGIQSGTIGYYNTDGTLITDTITYTLSDDTAENAQKEKVHYVDSVTFPIEYESAKYELTLFVNSNVMGTQFTKDGYAATLSVDWSSLSVDGAFDTDNKPSDSNDSGEQKPSSNGTNAENKDGLNIYPADENSDKNSESDESAVTGNYTAYFRENILISVTVVAGIMIICGSALVIVARKEKKNE